MTQLKESTQKIEEFRDLTYQSVNEKEELTDHVLVALSQKLDDLLNEYHSDRLIDRSQ